MILDLFVARWMGPRTQGIWRQRGCSGRTRIRDAWPGAGHEEGRRRLLKGRVMGLSLRINDTGFTWATFSLGLAGLLIAVYAMLMPHSSPFLAHYRGFGVMMSGALSFFNLVQDYLERFGVLAGASIAAGVVSLGSIGH